MLRGKSDYPDLKIKQRTMRIGQHCLTREPDEQPIVRPPIAVSRRPGFWLESYPRKRPATHIATFGPVMAGCEGRDGRDLPTRGCQSPQLPSPRQPVAAEPFRASATRGRRALPSGLTSLTLQLFLRGSVRRGPRKPPPAPRAAETRQRRSASCRPAFAWRNIDDRSRKTCVRTGAGLFPVSLRRPSGGAPL